MKYVYVVSDSYLRPLVKESEEFSFAVKGYCSIYQGIKNLKYSNMEDILGFAIVLQELPEELNELITLVNKLNMIANDKPVVLALYDGNGLDVLRPYIEHDNIKLSIVADFEDMTDKIIKSRIYGFIVRENYKPYLEDEESSDNKLYSHKSLKYKPLFDKEILKLCEEVVKAPSLESALKIDKVLKEFDEAKEDILVFLRRCQIIIYYEHECPKANDDVFKQLVSTLPVKEKVNYNCFYKLIKEERL